MTDETLAIARLPLELFERFTQESRRQYLKRSIWAPADFGLWLRHTDRDGGVTLLSAFRYEGQATDENSGFEHLLTLNAGPQETTRRCRQHDRYFVRLGIGVVVNRTQFNSRFDTSEAIAGILEQMAGIIRAAADLEATITQESPFFCPVGNHLLDPAHV